MRNIDTSSVDEVHEDAEVTELDIIEDDDWMVRWTSACKQLGKIWTGGTENNLTVERLLVTTLYSFLQKIFCSVLQLYYCHTGFYNKKLFCHF